MKNYYFWSIVKKFNTQMQSGITGPNCIDPNICKGNCCSIKIDVPKILAKEYIRRGFASKKDFIRGNVFSFYLNFDEKKRKCFLFNETINGCSVHNTGIKPPQCWIYPTNFSNPTNKEIKCKKVEGWKIIDEKKTKQAESLLQKYIFLCELEALKEKRKINKRLGKFPSKKPIEIIDNLKKMILNIAPSQLGGFKDSWSSFKILSAEGLSLQMKDFCKMHNKECQYISENFMECNNICDHVAERLISFFHDNLYSYVKKIGIEAEGDYPLYKLFNFVKNK